MAAGYRIKQGTRALFAFARPLDREAAQKLLPADLYALFRKMRRSEQMHSLAVLQALESEGDVPYALAVAALLHDVGKSRYPMNIIQRTLPVLVKAVSASALQSLSQRDPQNFITRGFAVYVHHPSWGAEMLRETDAPADGIWLVEHHADKPDDWREHNLYHLLKRLQVADDTN